MTFGDNYGEGNGGVNIDYKGYFNCLIWKLWSIQANCKDNTIAQRGAV